MHCDPVPLDLLVVQVHFALHWVIPLISSKVTSKGWQQICPMQESNSTVSQSVFTFAIIPESGHLPALEADGILFLYRMEFSCFTGDLKKKTDKQQCKRMNFKYFLISVLVVKIYYNLGW